jgi:poly(ADP-ribose) polymerase-like protein
VPDRIEIASSGRARCRACRRAISKGEERFAEAVPNPAAEGESQHYYHLACASERRAKPFAALLPTLEPPRPELAELEAAAAFTLEHHRLERLGALERAKSARASCRECREPIEKDGWRVALQPIEEGRLASWGFVHLACVGAYVGVKPRLDRLTRYTELEATDKDEIARVLDALPTPEPRTNEPDDAEANAAPHAPQRAVDDAPRGV